MGKLAINYIPKGVHQIYIPPQKLESKKLFRLLINYQLSSMLKQLFAFLPRKIKMYVGLERRVNVINYVD